jgi:outer membrane lipoprotein-sorting protein
MNAALVAIALSACAFAQGAAKTDGGTPTVDQVLDKYVQAIGGKAAIEKQTSRAGKGTFEIPAFGASGTAETYEKAPNKSAAIIDIPGFGVIREGYDGKVAWSQDPQSGLREKTGVELASTKLESEFHRAIKLKSLYPKIVIKGKEKVGDKDAIVLEATPTEGPVETWYFDAASGLLVRQDAERESPQGKMPVQVFFDEYKEFDGVKVPVAIRQITPAFALNIKIEEVKNNVPVDDAKFVKPSN